MRILTNVNLTQFLNAVVKALLPTSRNTARNRVGTAPSLSKPSTTTRGSGASSAGGGSPSGTENKGIVEYQAPRGQVPTISYSPVSDGDADPGEIVWGWVPYEEDPTQGKDRPLLVVGTVPGNGRATDLIAVQLTSKDHSRDTARDLANGRIWLDIGSGAWDSKGRDSEVRIDRLLRLSPHAIRREGAVLDRQRFDRVVATLRKAHTW